MQTLLNSDENKFFFGFEVNRQLAVETKKKGLKLVLWVPRSKTRTTNYLRQLYHGHLTNCKRCKTNTIPSTYQQQDVQERTEERGGLPHQLQHLMAPPSSILTQQRSIVTAEQQPPAESPSDERQAHGEKGNGAEGQGDKPHQE